MPYIAIKAYPKEEEKKNEIARRINQAFLDVWGCSQEAISISFEEISPENWEGTVVEKDILPNADKMYILNGEKKF